MFGSLKGAAVLCLPGIFLAGMCSGTSNLDPPMWEVPCQLQWCHSRTPPEEDGKFSLSTSSWVTAQRCRSQFPIWLVFVVRASASHMLESAPPAIICKICKRRCRGRSLFPPLHGGKNVKYSNSAQPNGSALLLHIGSGMLRRVFLPTGSIKSSTS